MLQSQEYWIVYHGSLDVRLYDELADDIPNNSTLIRVETINGQVLSSERLTICRSGFVHHPGSCPSWRLDEVLRDVKANGHQPPCYRVATIGSVCGIPLQG